MRATSRHGTARRAPSSAIGALLGLFVMMLGTCQLAAAAQPTAEQVAGQAQLDLQLGADGSWRVLLGDTEISDQRLLEMGGRPASAQVVADKWAATVGPWRTAGIVAASASLLLLANDQPVWGVLSAGAAVGAGWEFLRLNDQFGHAGWHVITLDSAKRAVDTYNARVRNGLALDQMQ